MFRLGTRILKNREFLRGLFGFSAAMGPDFFGVLRGFLNANAMHAYIQWKA